MIPGAFSIQAEHIGCQRPVSALTRQSDLLFGDARWGMLPLDHLQWMRPRQPVVCTQRE